MKIKNIRHTGIVTDNMTKSLKFYKDLLGFKIKKKMIEKGDTTDALTGFKKTKVETVKLVSPDKNSMIELLKYKSPTPKKKSKHYEVSQVGISHMAFSVYDLKKTYKKLLKKKVYFKCEPKLSSDKKVFLTFCKAPEGTWIELVQEI
tara:strand:+ start:1993 stop:2433 length:441 start_codon:yes stop_codon:yes gene_type:complete